MRLCLTIFLCFSVASSAADNFLPENLVAWCIVPFDAKKRSPEERAVMLKELGIGRCAYDWRKEHVAEFEAEIRAYKRHGIEYFAFWGEHEKAFELFEKYRLSPQIWKTAPSPKAEDQKDKVNAAADEMEPLAAKAKVLGSKLGLYNHGGWGGEPANLVAVCQELRSRGHGHVGIVYNWHHGHAQIGEWKEHLKLMKPFLICLNINGMNSSAKPKILALGKGEHEESMLKTVIASGYAGPIGILDHQQDLDSETALRQNLNGIRTLAR